MGVCSFYKTGGSRPGTGLQKPGGTTGIHRAAKPYITCRCGHAEVWHENPARASKKDSSQSALFQADSPHRQSISRQASTPVAKYGASDASATLAGGVLRKTASALVLGNASVSGKR